MRPGAKLGECRPGCLSSIKGSSFRWRRLLHSPKCPIINMTEPLWHVSCSAGQIPQNPHGSAPSPKAWEGPQRPGSDAAPQYPPPQPSRAWREPEGVVKGPDLLPSPWPWHPLNPLSFLFTVYSPLSKHVLTSPDLSPWFTSFMSLYYYL